MQKYALDFLHTEWEGRGFDLELAASANGIDVARCFNEVVLACCQQKPLDGHLSRLTPRPMQALNLVTFRQLAGLPFDGYVEFAAPNQVAIGGAAESFYTGDETSDLRIASRLAALIVDATSSATEVAFAFGIAGTAGARARRLLRDSYLKGNSTKVRADELAQSLFEVCKALRPSPA